MNRAQIAKSQYRSQLQECIRECDALRQDEEAAQDISLAEYVQVRFGVSMEAFYADLGLNPSTDTVANIVNLPETEMRWLLPEIFRAPIRLGLRRAPIWNNLVAASQTVKGLSVTQPSINMSDAMPLYTGVAETIRVGDVSFGQKSVKLQKFARGIKVPYEVINYVSINVVGIFLQDFGIKMGQGVDTLALQTLTNGEQLDGSESAPVIGIKTANSLVYRDITTPFIRMVKLGKDPRVMIAGEDMALDIMDLEEYRLRSQGTTQASLNVKTPIPTSTDLYIHGAMSDDQVMIVDPSMAMIKYDGQPLLVESEKIVSNQTEASYASFITGFGIAFRDARIIVDRTLLRSVAGFPSYMDYTIADKEAFGK